MVYKIHNPIVQWIWGSIFGKAPVLGEAHCEQWGLRAVFKRPAEMGDLGPDPLRPRLA